MIEKQITVFIAYDGAEFRDLADCQNYENDFRSRLAQHVSNCCHTTYCDDAGFAIIEQDNVANYLIAYSEELISILTEINKMKAADNYAKRGIYK